MQAAVMIHRMLWWKKGVHARMQARCCCDSQNALVKKVLSLRCHASAAVVIHRMLWCAIPWLHARCHDSQNALVQGRVLSLRCHASSAAVMIHRMLWWKKGAIPCAAMQLLLL
jgi:hypothetical protein